MPPPRHFEQKMRIFGAALPCILALKLAKNASAAPPDTKVQYKNCNKNLGAAPPGTKILYKICNGIHAQM